MSENNNNDGADTRTSLEVIAPNVEEAIAKGLEDLGLSEEAVDIEILDEGSRGLLGIGSRQARVRLTIKEFPDSEETVPDTLFPQKEQAGNEEPTGESIVESIEATEGGPEEQPLQPSERETPELSAKEEEAISVARDTVVDLLERMGIEAHVEAYYAEPDDERSRAPLWVDVTGEDLSILIGHRAETLNALQYITSLIIGKELARSVPLVVDVQGYRKRRAREVRLLARRMADQAVKTGRRQILEPMPANERRLVHIELRSNPLVTTESVGEEPRRKVTIIPVEPEED